MGYAHILPSGRIYSDWGKALLQKKKWRDSNKEKLKKYDSEYQRNKGSFVHYKANAKSRDLDFSLSRDEFESFRDVPCSYCNDEVIGVHLDRVNNEVGYTIANVVSCCEVCNRMKRNHTKDYFIEKCIKIASNY
jgi:uncharacterized protein with PIN domain